MTGGFLMTDVLNLLDYFQAERTLSLIDNSARNAGYEPFTPLKLFQKIHTDSVWVVKFTAEGPFRVRILLFFKAIVSLHDLEGLIKLFIAFLWAVFGAISGRIIVTIEIKERIAETCASVDVNVVGTYLKTLQDRVLNPAEITPSKAVGMLISDCTDADRIVEIFNFASEGEDLPIILCNFDNLCGGCHVVRNRNVDSHLLEVLFALAIYFGLKIRLYADNDRIVVASTGRYYDSVAMCTLGKYCYSVFADTTGRGKEIVTPVCASLDELAQEKVNISDDRIIGMYLGRNAGGGLMQCFLC
jgi:hypothetical protein